jgi:hypothetical protein
MTTKPINKPADHYGPAEVLVGRFLASEPGLRESCQVPDCLGQGGDIFDPFFGATGRAAQSQWPLCQQHTKNSTTRHHRPTLTKIHNKTEKKVATKYCVFSGQEMAGVSAASVRRAVDRSRQRLGVAQIDLLQFYWGSYEVPRYVDAALYLMDLKAEGWIKEVCARCCVFCVCFMEGGCVVLCCVVLCCVVLCCVVLCCVL